MRAIDRVIERFPEMASTARALYLRDERFRSICDDLSLAFASLQAFEQRPDANARPEIADYRQVLEELEAELESYLRTNGSV